MRLVVFLLLSLVVSLPAHAAGEGWQHLTGTSIVLFRHAHAPGVGDPPGFVLGDCSTQRNLDERGRGQARAIGAAFRQQGVMVGRALASQWCRSTETAELAFPGRVIAEPAFNSFFNERGDEPERTRAARGILMGWDGPGVLVVVTHQVNIAALTGETTASGEGLVVAVAEGDVIVKGRITTALPE